MTSTTILIDAIADALNSNSPYPLLILMLGVGIVVLLMLIAKTIILQNTIIPNGVE